MEALFVSALVVAISEIADKTHCFRCCKGVLCVDVPSVLVGSALPAAIPLRVLRFAGAGLFGALAAATVFGIQLAPA